MRRATQNQRGKRKPTVAIVGAGSLASFLAPALTNAGYTITEVVVRGNQRSLRRGRFLARKVGAQVKTASSQLTAKLVWFAVPDREIRPAAASLLVSHPASKLRFAFHSSGVLDSDELNALRKVGMAVASVHPLMTFVAGAMPSLAGVSFALEGDKAATAIACRIINDLGGTSIILQSRRKAAYHAWATMTSPLLVAFLVTLEEAAEQAGFARQAARNLSLPIIRQTLANYGVLGPADSFSGPFIRGDAATVAKHLALLKTSPNTRAVYAALAQVALQKLPVKNREELRRLLEIETGKSDLP